MYTLAIETANKTLSVALFKNNMAINDITTHDTLQHSVHLVPAIHNLLKHENITLNMVNQVVVSNGPGSYTGLRVGVTFAKTLAYTLNIPLIAVSSLSVLAQSANTKKVVVAFFDARRKHVFAGIYQEGKPLLEDCYLPIEKLLDITKEYGKDILFVSPDMPIYEQDILNVYGESSICQKLYPNAKHMGIFLQQKAIEDVHVLTPFYINKVEAELNWEKQQNGVLIDQEWVETWKS